MTAPLIIIDHPLVQVRLARLRDAAASHAEFRQCVHAITRLMAYEITRDWETQERKVQTPLTSTQGRELQRTPVLAPILRAGLGMLHGMLEVLPEARVAHIGMFRNEETKQPESYYFRAPCGLDGADTVLLDPMLATGNSAAAAASQLREMGANRLRFACIIAAPEGVQRFHQAHPDIPVFTAALDAGLTSTAFITPGLGDAGDRYFGTV